MSMYRISFVSFSSPLDYNPVFFGHFRNLTSLCLRSLCGMELEGGTCFRLIRLDIGSADI